MKFRSLIIITLALSSVMSLSAQKFGHINSAVIIQEHPRVSEANAQLEAYKDSLVAPFKVKADSFQAQYLAFVEAANSGSLSQVALEAKQSELRQLQETLGQEEQQIQFRIMQKREEFLKPILAEIDGYIQTIGKEGGYTMIFDTSVAGGLVFAEEADDLTDDVKSRCMAKQ